jgi:hypothetical protein
MKRVGLMGGFLNSTNAITTAVVYFMEKVWISYRKTKYQPTTDILRVSKFRSNLWISYFFDDITTFCGPEKT